MFEILQLNADRLTANAFYFFGVCAFLFGACLGSFLNVVVWRMPRGKSVIFPPSHCPRCKHRLAWYENLPVVSWMFLRGRCLSCKLPISVKYPLGELLTALLYTAVYLKVCYFK